MKSNLDQFFKSDKEAEESGIWFEIKEGVGFKVKRFGGYNSSPIKAALAKHYKPFAKAIEMNAMPEEKQREIQLKVFVDSCVIDWKGIEIDGKEEPYSKDACVKLLMSLPNLAEALVSHAADSANYKEDLGNS